ncbi:GyrI-like domain-containing protein [Winogradskyella sp. 3972H.M.0a.05]|uniref:AraC family transcriptional regulator n=1 Tax=Winogradskyella sp. 3972H.M.0a.05 TaxID=2950277 RepID=UPI00339AF08B
MTNGDDNKTFYLEKLNLVKEYINNHLDEKISIETLAELSCFSPYHFHRISRALLNEPIGSYINRIRLETASKLMLYGKQSMEQIAYSVGFDRPSSLSKAFKKQYGISPTEFKNGKSYLKKPHDMETTTLNIKKPKLVHVEDKNCIYTSLNGAYQTLDYAGAWGKLWQEVKAQKLFTAGIEHVGQSFDDPAVTDAEKIRYDACLVIHKDAKPNGDIGVKTLKGGKFMMFHYTGSYSKFAEVYDYIFNTWLLNSDYKLRDEAPREVYRNNPERTEESKLKTEIWVPVE